MDEPGVRPDMRLEPNMLGNAALTHPEQKHVANCNVSVWLRNQPAVRCGIQDFLVVRLGLVLGIGRDDFRFIAVKRPPDASEQTKAIRPGAPGACLVHIGRSKPKPCFGNCGVCNRHQPLPPTRRTPAEARSGTGYEASQSSPGICGKPRKFRKLANLTRQVFCVLSQPACRRT